MKKSRVILWIILIAISISGVALHLITPASADDLPHPLNGAFRMIHGVASALGLFIFGYFFADHVQKKFAKYHYQWRSHLWDGYCHLLVWVLLIVTGLLLYYPPEKITAAGVNIIAIHWYLGLLLIGLFPFHFWRKSIKRYQSRRQWEQSVAKRSKSDN